MLVCKHKSHKELLCTGIVPASPLHIVQTRRQLCSTIIFTFWFMGKFIIFLDLLPKKIVKTCRVVLFIHFVNASLIESRVVYRNTAIGSELWRSSSTVFNNFWQTSLTVDFCHIYYHNSSYGETNHTWYYVLVRAAQNNVNFILIIMFEVFLFVFSEVECVWFVLFKLDYACE